MAQIHNSDLIKGMAENAKIQQNVDRIPNQLADKVVPTMETNPALLKTANVVRYVDTNIDTTIYTTPSDRDFYLTGISYSLAKDALSTCSGIRISGTIDGVTQWVGIISGITLTTDSQTVSQNFSKPIKFDRGVNISIIHLTGTGATLRSSVTLVGYTVDNIKA